MEPEPSQPKPVISAEDTIAACEAEVLAALTPILDKYHCRLGTFQQVIDGQPGPVQVRVFLAD